MIRSNLFFCAKSSFTHLSGVVCRGLGANRLYQSSQHRTAVPDTPTSGAVCRSAVQNTSIQDGGSRPGAETLRLALQFGAMSSAAVPPAS